MPAANSQLVGHDIGQQGQVARAFDFSRQLALAARAIAGLAPRFYLAAFADIARNGVQVLVVKAFALRAIGGLAPTPSPPGTAARKTAASKSATTLLALTRGACISVAWSLLAHSWLSLSLDFVSIG